LCLWLVKMVTTLHLIPSSPVSCSLCPGLVL
jgi:hypothetical protein